MNSPDLPRYDELMLPVVEVLEDMGGSGLRNEVIAAVADRQEFSDEQLEVRYETTGVAVIADRIGWALSYLKKCGAVENSRRGVWALTEEGRRIESEEHIRLRLKALKAEMAVQRHRSELQGNGGSGGIGADGDVTREAAGELGGGELWKDVLRRRLLEMSPGGFERLAQRLLREAGFRDVEVLGKSGDGGIDGVGVYRLSLVSFPVYFQCKRYKGNVPAGAVRDFRGAMAGRGEKGLLVTTGSFTSGAREEASRDGAPPVELVDGDDLCDLLKEYELGVRTRQVEAVDVETGFFEQFEDT